MKAKHLFLLTVSIVLLIVAVIGAMSVLMVKETVIVLTFDGDTPDEAAVALTHKILAERIKAFGALCDVRSGTVEYGDPDFVITLRGHKDFSFFSELLLKENETRLYLVAGEEAHDALDSVGRVPEGFEQHTITHELLKLGSWGETHKTEEAILLRKEPEMVISRVKAVHMARNGWFREPVITIEFDERQSAEFAAVTKEHVGERLAVAIEGEVFTAPGIQGEISDGVVQIKNIVYFPKAEKLYNLLRIGALPAALKVVEIKPPPGEEPEPAEIAHGPAAK